MKIEKIRKSHKKELITGGLIISLVGILTFSLTRAMFQNIEDIKLVEGTVNYVPYDYRLAYINVSGKVHTCDASINKCEEMLNYIPSSGFTINSNSYCEKRNTDGTYTRDISIVPTYQNGTIVTSKSNQKARCYIYLDDTEKPTVGNVTISSTETSISVTVTASDNVGVTEYWYQIGTNTAVKGTGNTYTFTGLTIGTTYSIKVYVKDAAGNQSATTTKSIAITDTTKPTISNVTSSLTMSSISVTVTASDNVGVTEYWYQIGTNTAVKGTGNTYTFSGLSAGTTYSIKVYVKDAAGNQSATTTKSITTNTQADETLAKLNITSYKTTTPDFSQIATTDEGVYRVSDGMYGGYSYYWRGAVTNNYVTFGGFCWRIIRINGDGTIRLIYDGSSCHANGTSLANSALTGIVYNSNYDRSEYVGWTFETGLQRPASTLGISNAYQYSNQFYRSLAIQGYSGKIATGKFCNDRNVAPGYRWASTGSDFNYAAYYRINNGAPTLSCNESDTYSINIGFITVDEVMYAGGIDGMSNTAYYLYNGQNYWTMSPVRWYHSYAYVNGVSSDGSITNANVHFQLFPRPVINLKEDTTFASGNGTLDNPYVVS